MRIKVSTRGGGPLNVRKAMTGKGEGIILTTLPNGSEHDAKETKGGEWYRVGPGYVRAELCRVID